MTETTNLVIYPESCRCNDELPESAMAVMFRAAPPAIVGLLFTLLGYGRLTLDRVVASARAAGISALVRQAPRDPRALARSATHGAIFVSEDGEECWHLSPSGRVQAACDVAAAASMQKEMG
jgi:hypothetical protein